MCRRGLIRPDRDCAGQGWPGPTLRNAVRKNRRFLADGEQSGDAVELRNHGQRLPSTAAGRAGAAPRQTGNESDPDEG